VTTANDVFVADCVSVQSHERAML